MHQSRCFRTIVIKGKDLPDARVIASLMMSNSKSLSRQIGHLHCRCHKVMFWLHRPDSRMRLERFPERNGPASVLRRSDQIIPGFLPGAPLSPKFPICCLHDPQAKCSRSVSLICSCLSGHRRQANKFGVGIIQHPRALIGFH